MVTVLEREIETGGSASSSSTPNENGTGSNAGQARASGVEEHVTSAHARPGHGDAGGGGGEKKKREYTAKQMEVVKRVKGCKQYEYYEILAGE